MPQFSQQLVKFNIRDFRIIEDVITLFVMPNTITERCNLLRRNGYHVSVERSSVTSEHIVRKRKKRFTLL